MLILEPMAHETIWGGGKLLAFADKPCSKVGHLYSIFDDLEASNIILNGKYAGKTLKEWFTDNKHRIGLGSCARFPLIIALVEAAENLSIQVHPDDQAARLLERAEFGKNESWYFLEAPDDGWIYNGCSGDFFKEEGVARLRIEAGDYVYVEAGTVHAMTKGSFVYEVEENSPYTYRINDFARLDSQGARRELHIEKAKKAVKSKLQSRTRRYNNSEIAERMYATRPLVNINGYSNKSDMVECITLLSGAMTVEGVKIHVGSAIILEPNETLDGHIERAMLARPRADACCFY